MMETLLPTSIKIILKRLMPRPLIDWGKLLLYKRRLFVAYFYDYSRYSRYAGSHLEGYKDRESEIIRIYHILEKGLTMPEMRMGFGEGMVMELSNLILQYMTLHKIPTDQVIHAAGVLIEYKNIHQDAEFQLRAKILTAIDEAVCAVKVVHPARQLHYSASEYFKKSFAPFAEFALSRHSCRNFDDRPIDPIFVEKALELARTAPSACNRQCWRTYVYTQREQIEEILNLQGGSRGFGHLADRLIVVCGKLASFIDIIERNQAFIDGGIYAMNLLYSLHHYNIGTCILNCCHTPERDKAMRRLTSIGEDEVFIAMIACGNVSQNLKVAVSPRKPLSTTNVTFQGS